MQPLRQSTAATLVIGPFVDDADGKTAETALTIAQADVLLHKSDGTSIAQKNDATSATHRSSGYYTVPVDATDTGTLGRLRVMVSKSGALPAWQDYMVVPAAVYDSLVLGTDYLQTDAVQVEGVDATNQIRDAVVDDATRLDASALNTLSSHDPGEAIMGATDLGTGSGLTAVPWNSAWDAEVQSECADALIAYDAATGTDVTSAHSTTNGKIDAVDDYVDTEVAAIKAVTDKLDTALELDGAAYRYTTNALEQAPTGSGASAADIADAVWDEAIAGHADVGSTGASLAAAGGSGDPWATALPGSYGAGTAGALIGGVGADGAGLSAIPWNAAWDAEVRSECADALNAYGFADDDLVAAAVRTELATELGRIDEAVSAAKTLTSAYDAAKTAATQTDVTAIKAVTTKLDTAMEVDGVVHRFTANALEQAPTASGSGSAEDIWSYANRSLTSGAGSVTVVSPVSIDGESIELVHGDDYAAADGRALSWTSDDWPDLTGASLALHIAAADGTVTIAGTASGSGTQTVTVAPSAADTAAMSVGFCDFELGSTLASGRVVTLVMGTCRVRPSVD